MKILHISDIHGDINIINKAKTFQADIVCISGDLIYSANDIPIIKEFISSFDIPILISSGNHDYEIDEAKWIKELKDKNIFVDGDIVTINNITFGIVPYFGEFSEFYSVDVLIYHIPPSNTFTSIDKNYRDFGDDTLKTLLKKDFTPKYLLCGHQHKPQRLKDKINKTTIINACYKKDNIYLLNIKDKNV